MLSLQVHPGKGLGNLGKLKRVHAAYSSTNGGAALGSSLHETLTRLKAQPLVYPSIDISYTPSKPLTAPVILDLPANGLRLRFDGPEQTLRLIEVVDFAHTQLSYKDVDFAKLPESPTAAAVGPAFRHVYNMMGPTFPGEYLPPISSFDKTVGLYVLSYPGIAFSFPFQCSAWNPKRDHVSLLSSSAASPAKSLAIFEGSSWHDVRRGLFDPKILNTNTSSPNRLKDHRADDVEHVNIYGNGKLEMLRRLSPPFRLLLGETTAQDLVAELGPPDAIYYKNDRRMSIHQTRTESQQQEHRRQISPAIEDDLTDGDHSSLHNTEDDSDEESDGFKLTNGDGNLSPECFYNYFHHGFDVFISYPRVSSPPFPLSISDEDERLQIGDTDHLVATKLIMHGNVPGSYPFNRYRRVRWTIDTKGSENGAVALNSETPFRVLSQSLQKIWKGHAVSNSERLSDKAKKEIWVINRGWGDSPGDSCELLGGWEEHTDFAKKRSSGNGEGPGSGTTELVGFPGLVFEVLTNDAVSCLTIY